MDNKRQRYESYLAKAKANDWQDLMEHWQALIDKLDEEEAERG